MLNRLLGQEVALTEAAIAVAAVLVLAWLLAHLAARSTRVILRHIVGDTDQVSFKAPIVRTPIRIVWVVVFLLVATPFLLYSWRTFGQDPFWATVYGDQNVPHLLTPSLLPLLSGLGLLQSARGDHLLQVQHQHHFS